MAKSIDPHLQRALDFIDTARKSTSFDDVARAFETQMRWFGFDYVTCWTLQPSGRSQMEGVILNTPPLDYVENYVRNNYAAKDPVITYLRPGSSSYTWDDVRAARELSKLERRIIDEARDFGATNGMVIPIATDSAGLSTVCPCGSVRDLSARARSALELVAIYGMQSMWRLRAGRSGESRQKVLTAREREVLYWIAIGKSDAEISEILRISASTVTHHVENVKSKLGVLKRTVAVVEALRRGEISL